MKQTFQNFKFEKFNDYLMVSKNGLNYMMVTKLEGLENLDLILSLIKRMIFLGESHFSISFERLRSKYSDGNKFGFSKSKKQAYHIQKYDNLRPVC